MFLGFLREPGSRVELPGVSVSVLVYYRVLRRFRVLGYFDVPGGGVEPVGEGGEG